MPRKCARSRVNARSTHAHCLARALPGNLNLRHSTWRPHMRSADVTWGGFLDPVSQVRAWAAVWQEVCMLGEGCKWAVDAP